jgi:integrase
MICIEWLHCAPVIASNNDVDLVTVQKLFGHANVQTTAHDDQRGERAKKKAVGTLHVPYRRRTR